MAKAAVIYCRISRDREGAGLGVDRQLADCQELAERLGWPIVATLTDNDMSAYSGKPRPGYKRLLAMLRAGEASAVVAWHTDRLHRSPRELEEFVDICESRDVAVHTVKAGPLDLSSPSGRMVARQLGAVARYETEHQVERSKRAKLQAATAGEWRGGRRPFGYAADGLTVVASEAAEVALATAAVLAGASLHGIAREWNTRGVATSTGREWKASEVKRLLTRPRNAGLMQHRGEVIGQASWPAIVDEDRWRAAMALLSDPQRRTSPGNGRRWLGSGLFRCGVCNLDVLLVSTSGKTTGHKSVAAYRCRSRGHVTRNAAILDDYVGGIIVARLNRPDAVDLLRVREDIDTSSLHAEAVTLRQRMDGLTSLYAEGSVTGRQLAKGTQQLRAALDGVEAQLVAASQHSALAAFASTADAGVVWESLDLDRRRAVLDTLMVVTVNRGRRGRLPDGSYFDAEAIRVEWRHGTP